jgi:hypothetical protein
MHVDDMDGDGDVDIIAILATAIVWFENLSNGVFSEEIIITSLVPSQSVFSIYASDLDNDGDKDIIAGAAGFNNFEQVPKTLIIINNGDGTFQAPMIISESHFMAANIHAADIDNDGDNDILSPNANGPLTRGWYFFENLYEGEVINSTINNNNISNQISIFPNPFSHYTTIRFEQPLTSAYDIKIFDSTGKVVRLYQSLKDSEFKIYKNQLSTGVYFLNFYESGQQEILASKKLIVH